MGGDCCGAALYYCERFRGFKVDLSCCAANICLTSTIHTGRCGRVCLLSFLLGNLNANIGDLCVKSSCDAALHYCKRFRGFKVDLSSCAANICLTSIVHAGRCGRVCLLSFLLGNLNANIGDLCVKSSCDAVLHYCERTRTDRQDVRCLSTNIYLISVVQIGRCWRISFFEPCSCQI